MDTTQALVVAILVIVVLLLLFQIVLFKEITRMSNYFNTDPILPSELRLDTSFLSSSKSNKKSKKS